MGGGLLAAPAAAPWTARLETLLPEPVLSQDHMVVSEIRGTLLGSIRESYCLGDMGVPYFRKPHEECGIAVSCVTRRQGQPSGPLLPTPKPQNRYARHVVTAVTMWAWKLRYTL